MKINTGNAKYCNEGLKPGDLTKYAAYEKYCNQGLRPEDLGKFSSVDLPGWPADEQTKALLAQAEESIPGFMPWITNKRPPPDTELSKAYWSVYVQGNSPEAGGKMELYDCDFKAIDKGAKPGEIVECHRPVNPTFFVDNRKGLVYGVLERRGLKFNVLFLGYTPVCQKAGNFRTCVHEID